MRRHFRKKKQQTREPEDAMTDVLSAEAVASLPPPGLSGPSQPVWSPQSSRYLAYISSNVQSVRRLIPSPALYKPLTSTSASNGAPPSAVGSTGSPNTPITTATTTDRRLLVINLQDEKLEPRPLLRFEENATPNKRSLEHPSTSEESLEEKLRRERQRLSSGSSLTQFEWAWIEEQSDSSASEDTLRLLIPVRGSLFVQDGVNGKFPARCIHDKSIAGTLAAVDPQLSPDASMVLWTADGEIYCKSVTALPTDPAIRLTYGAVKTEAVCISHGIADFVAQEEIDRYSGVWWSPTSEGILFTRVDESMVPIFRIVHYPSQQMTPSDAPVQFEDHRYPFAGKRNPVVRLGYVKIDRGTLLGQHAAEIDANTQSSDLGTSAAEVAAQNWNSAIWFEAPREANEYLARVYWLPDGRTVITQWQNRAQNVSVFYRMDIESGRGRTLLIERSELWINLNHMFHILTRPIHPEECLGVAAAIPTVPQPLPKGSFSFLLASERTGFSHLYLYTFVPGINGDQAMLLRAISEGDWVVESIAGVDESTDTVFLTGTYDSVLERHLYALPLTGRDWFADDIDGEGPLADNHHLSSSPNGMRTSISKMMTVLSGKSKVHSTGAALQARPKPIRLTAQSGMHSIVMDSSCRYFVDTNSDLDRPSVMALYELPVDGVSFKKRFHREGVRLIKVLFEAEKDDRSLSLLTGVSGSAISLKLATFLPPPEIFGFPSADGAETLYAAVYRPDARVYGPGPYPLISAVYGGPHVQRVNRSFTQCADMRAQRLRNLGYCVLKCDNRGSSRRGLAFESAIARNLGRTEVLDQVAAVQQLIIKGLADPTRVGIYGWSYGGYLAAMCLCRAPDVFHAAVAGAPVTSWDAYDTHYTERYMGLPSENPSGYQESAVFDHVPNMRGKLLIVHGLIDENVHFRHSSRLINKLTHAGKEYELLVFPDERHSPRRLRDRVYMEQRISDFFARNLSSATASPVDLVDTVSQGGVKRSMAGLL